MEIGVIRSSTARMNQATSNPTHQQLIRNLEMNYAIQLLMIFGQHFVQLQKLIKSLQIDSLALLPFLLEELCEGSHQERILAHILPCRWRP